MKKTNPFSVLLLPIKAIGVFLANFGRLIASVFDRAILGNKVYSNEIQKSLARTEKEELEKLAKESTKEEVKDEKPDDRKLDDEKNDKFDDEKSDDKKPDEEKGDKPAEEKGDEPDDIKPEDEKGGVSDGRKDDDEGILGFVLKNSQEVQFIAEPMSHDDIIKANKWNIVNKVITLVDGDSGGKMFYITSGGRIMDRAACLAMYPDDSSQRIGTLELKQNDDYSFSVEARSLSSSHITEPITYVFTADDLIEPDGGGNCRVIENLEKIYATIQSQIAKDENYDRIYSTLFSASAERGSYTCEFSMQRGVPEEFDAGMSRGVQLSANNENGLLTVILESVDPNVDFSTLNCYIMPDEKELALFTILDELSNYNAMVQDLPSRSDNPRNDVPDSFDIDVEEYGEQDI